MDATGAESIDLSPVKIRERMLTEPHETGDAR